MAALPEFQSDLPWSGQRSVRLWRRLAPLLLVILVLPGCSATLVDTEVDAPTAEAPDPALAGSATRILPTVVAASAVLPGEALGAITTPAVAARIAQQAGDLNPLTDGWETEALSEASNLQLAVLGGLLKHPAQLEAAQFADLLTDDFSCGDLLASEMVNAFDDEPLLVERGVIDAAVVGQQLSGAHQGAGGLLAALGALVEPLLEATDVHVKFKLYNVDVADDSYTTRQFVSISGHTPSGMVEQNATWLIRWVRASATAPPRIAWIGVEESEHVTTTGGGPLFADVTEAVLGGDPAYANQLAYGIDYWFERLESVFVREITGIKGLAIGDVNGDGLEDVYVCQLGGFPNLLFIQQPDGTVRNMAVPFGVDILDFTYAALLIDLDNDGDQDLVAATGPQLLILSNDGQGHFKLRATVPVLNEGHSLAAIDYDGDGDLDIYGCRYFADNTGEDGLAGMPTFSQSENGGANVLLRNDITSGDEPRWQFTDVTAEVGLDENNRRSSFAAAWEDYDNDGDPDLYVGNDAGRNNLYRNDNGHFTDVAIAAGVEDHAFGMSVTWGDYNRDGLMDLYVSNMFSAAGNRITFQDQFRTGISGEDKSDIQYTARGNSLFENNGDGTFRDVSVEAGVTMGRWSWGSLFADINNDGWDDLLVGNGYLTRDNHDDL